MLTRRQITAALVAALQPLDAVRAATLAGSDATGRADDLSDIDIVVFVAPGHVEAAADAIDAALRALSPVRVHIRLPMPTWHGFNQAFYQLKDAPEHLMIDCVIIETGTPHPWFEVERHGTHKVLFDKDRLVKPVHVDRPAIEAAIRKRVDEIRLRSPLFRHLPVKLAGPRSLPADAAYFYHAMILRPLVDMLRITHAPDRHDFGFRYLKDDLPPAEYQAVVRLCYPRSAADIAGFTAEATRLTDELIARWDASRARSELSG
ncbi:MAG TPA: nucleotidyltransferase domain-containing protein [Phycisphaerales bacterium]|nr:nucleotidyltransferase domain-containing protein [Phycisphaerales bacterium]